MTANMIELFERGIETAFVLLDADLVPHDVAERLLDHNRRRTGPGGGAQSVKAPTLDLDLDLARRLADQAGEVRDDAVSDDLAVECRERDQAVAVSSGAAGDVKAGHGRPHCRSVDVNAALPVM